MKTKAKKTNETYGINIPQSQNLNKNGHKEQTEHKGQREHIESMEMKAKNARGTN